MKHIAFWANVWIWSLRVLTAIAFVGIVWSIVAIVLHHDSMVLVWLPITFVASALVMVMTFCGMRADKEP